MDIYNKPISFDKEYKDTHEDVAARSNLYWAWLYVPVNLHLQLHNYDETKVS
jgi:hypothetical protein